MNAPCGEVAWDVVGSAEALSALGGLIGGFMFAGIIVLLTEVRPSANFARVPALAQFFAAFIALGLNAYLVGLVAGEHDCRRIWTATAISSGMLAVGVVAAVGGVVFLIQGHLLRHTDNPIPADQLIRMKRLLRTTYILVAWMATLLMLARVGEALWVWLGWADLMIVVFCLGVLITGFYTVLVIARRVFPRLNEQPDPHFHNIYIGATVAALFSIIGTVVIGALLTTVNNDWSGWHPFFSYAMPTLIFLVALVPAFAIIRLVRGAGKLLASWPESDAP